MGAANTPQSESAEAATEVRCHCGSLVARLTTGGVELKCRRCKRVVLVTGDLLGDEWIEVRLHTGEGAGD